MGRAKSFYNDFKAFALKGNVIDLAIGVVVGTAFNAIVTSLVSDILMPLILAMTGHVSISKLTITFFGNITLNYGLFLQAVLNFLLITLSIFIVIRVAGKFYRKEEEKAKETPIPHSEELLEEIRDLLKEQARERKE